MKVSNTKPNTSVVFKTRDVKDSKQQYKWWLSKEDRELTGQLLSTAAFLKESQAYRYRQAAIYARLYGNMSLFSFIGSNMSMMDKMTGLPTDRPTFNLIQSATDTLVSK